MRNSDEVYWTTSLPRDHDALQELDACSREWGGLSRAEVTRCLLITKFFVILRQNVFHVEPCHLF